MSQTPFIILLPSLARLAPARLAALHSLLPSLRSASTRASAANRPSQARAYAQQHAAAAAELAAWQALVVAARSRVGAAVALLVAALPAADIHLALAVILAVGALVLMCAPRTVSPASVRPWTKVYALEARSAKPALER
jgi:hypothetical protein